MGKIDEGISILKAFGLPRAQQNERSALTLLALLDLKENSRWDEAKSRMIRIHDIMVFIQKHYGKQYAENTRETIRRQTLHQFEQAGIVVRNPDDPSRPTNSPNNVYTMSDDALEPIKKHGTTKWQEALNDLLQKKGKLIERYEKRKKKYSISVQLPGGMMVDFSPGKHNELQIRIVSEFRQRFCPDADVLYVGDAARKMLHTNDEALAQLNVPITKHDKLPDVVMYDKKIAMLFLVEAVTAHGPLSPKRQIDLIVAKKYKRKCT